MLRVSDLEDVVRRLSGKRRKNEEQMRYYIRRSDVLKLPSYSPRYLHSFPSTVVVEASHRFATATFKLW